MIDLEKVRKDIMGFGEDTFKAFFGDVSKKSLDLIEEMLQHITFKSSDNGLFYVYAEDMIPKNFIAMVTYTNENHWVVGSDYLKDSHETCTDVVFMLFALASVYAKYKTKKCDEEIRLRKLAILALDNIKSDIIKISEEEAKELGVSLDEE